MPEIFDSLGTSQHPQIIELERKINLLEIGKVVVIGGLTDVEYLTRQLEALRKEHPSLGLDLDRLLAKLKKVDPNLSSWENRSKRSPPNNPQNNPQVSTILEIMRVLGTVPGAPIKMTLKEAKEIVANKKLEDGIYTFKNTLGEIYIIVQQGTASHTFEPPTYDIPYLERMFKNLQYKGTVQIQ